MIYIDAREGLSGDTLIAAMLGLLEKSDAARAIEGIRGAANSHGLDLYVQSVEDAGDQGLSISYKETEPLLAHESSYDECFSMLADMDEHIGFSSPTASAILQTIFEAEGQAHGLPTTEVHLHEIGRPQAILNIAAIGYLSWRLIELGGGTFVSSTIVTGKGVVVVAHGAVRVPAPAARELLRNMMHATGDSPGERATPTGIAAVKVLSRYQSDDMPKSFAKRSVGFGSRSFGGRLGRTVMLWT